MVSHTIILNCFKLVLSSYLPLMVLSSYCGKLLKGASGTLFGRNQNKKVFSSKCQTAINLFQNLQVKCFDWILRRQKNKTIEWGHWNFFPMKFLDYSHLISSDFYALVWWPAALFSLFSFRLLIWFRVFIV